MHRQTPLTAAFVGYTGGGARALVDTVNDLTGMQEMAGSMMYGEARGRVESPQNYGFTSVVLPAIKDAKGMIQSAAEAYIHYLGGNRSFPVAGVMDDRRHRPWGLKPGENAQYDDIGQMTLMRRLGLFMLSLDGPDQDGKHQERMASLRHVNKKKQDRPKAAPEKKPDTMMMSAPTQQHADARDNVPAQHADAQAAQQQDPNGKDHQHEGESVNTEVRVTSGRIEFRSGNDVVGYYDKGSATWCFIGKIITLQSTDHVETIGKTNLGLDKVGETGPKVTTVGGPAKQTYAKV